ncbi:hypothetical protein KTH71_07230 [Acinetobacter sp. WU_MDCI_Axc73]|nr:hypothetical protein [Acinetobacter sp. WU_MDCI_Axc73]
MMIYLIGPGGAGKTTTAKLLALQLGYDGFDLDQYFMQNVGDISAFIDQFGYKQYAQKNIECYLALSHRIEGNIKSSIIVCSSGFMTYPEDVHINYMEIKQQILHYPFTFVLLPSLCFETCVQEIVTRQMKRPYLKTSPDKERDKITQRFYSYSQLACKIILTDVQPFQVVNNIKVQLD